MLSLSPLYFFRHVLPFTGYPYAGTPAACNLCGSRDAVVIGRTDRRLKALTSVCCTGCGLIRTDPMPTPEELVAYYAHAYRLDYQAAFGDRPPRFHVARSGREARARAALLAPALQPGSRVLDFGSGSGEFLSTAQEAGCEVVGIEPGRSYAAFARRYGVEVIQDASVGAFPPEHFDVITTHHVLEHLRDPVDVLARLAGWLAPDGVLYVSVPNMLATQKPPHERFHFAHVHGFVPETLDLAALRAGLEPDPRFPRAGTTVVYRKSQRPALASITAPESAARIVAAYPQRSVLRYVCSGAWVRPLVRRNWKVLRDSVARRPAGTAGPTPASLVGPGSGSPADPAALPRRRAG